MVTLGLAANAQHRTDAALGVWTKTGTGLRTVHENYDGWQIKKVTNGWTVTRPGCTVAEGYAPGRVSVWSALWVAKAEADRLIARDAENIAAAIAAVTA